MSLFGHLALRFGSQPENLATEALSYLLGRSANARRGFLASLRRDTLPSDLAFTTQHSTKDRGRPDLAGTDDSGDVRVLVEAKFWAGFTEHQPVGYIDQLPVGGVLVVICPSARTAYVWRELLNRLRMAKREVTETAAPGEIGHAIVDKKHLVLESWARVVNAIRLELAGEPDVLADAVQLDGLCARMDAEAFIPVTSEELTSSVFRRVHEFGRIVDDVVATLSADGTVSTKGMKAAHANGWYGRYLNLRGCLALLHVSTWKWHLLGPSPVWLTLHGKAWHADPGPVKKVLAAFAHANPGTVCEDHNDLATVMLRVPAGAERVDVVGALLDQLRVLGEIVAPLGVGAKEIAPPPDDGSSSDA